MSAEKHPELYYLIDKTLSNDKDLEVDAIVVHTGNGSPLLVTDYVTNNKKLLAQNLLFALALSEVNENDSLAMVNTPDGALIRISPEFMARLNKAAGLFLDQFISSIKIRTMVSSGYKFDLIEGEEADHYDPFRSDGHTLSLSKTWSDDNFSIEVEVLERHSNGLLEGSLALDSIPLSISGTTPTTGAEKDRMDVSRLAINTLVHGREKDVEIIIDKLGEDLLQNEDNKAHLKLAIESNLNDRSGNPDINKIARLMTESGLTIEDITINRNVDTLSAAINRIFLDENNDRPKAKKLSL